MDFLGVTQSRLSKIPNKTDPKTIKICSNCSRKFRITKLCKEKCPFCLGRPDLIEMEVRVRKHSKIDKVHEFKVRRPKIITMATKEFQKLTREEQSSCFYENGELKVVPKEKRQRYVKNPPFPLHSL